jgi:hypothetical protein
MAGASGRATLSARVLNRTLLHRQHLLDRIEVDPIEEIAHLVGLQAQETLPPYLSLFARVRGFTATQLSDAIGDGRLVRLLLMRGTIHAVAPADAVRLRALAGPLLERAGRTIASTKPVAHLSIDELVAAGDAVLADGPLPLADIGSGLERHFPELAGHALSHSLRYRTPLVQLPPRGMWRRSGGVVYDTLAHATGLAPPDGAADLRPILRRYLAAFGPASAADFSTWSGAAGAARVIAALGDELVRYTDDHGRTLVDLAGLPLADPDVPAPPRLFGRYDNVWLSHATRDRVTAAPARRRWAGTNGGVGNAFFVDGGLTGLWRLTGSGRIELDPFRRLSRAERSALDAEVVAVQDFLRT